MLTNQPLAGEFSRNAGKRGYRIKQAQSSADKRRLAACKSIKMTPFLIELIDLKLNEKWSPEQISGWFSEEKGINISHETIYQHILGLTSDGVATCLNVYAGKEKIISHAVRINRPVEGLLRTE